MTKTWNDLTVLEQYNALDVSRTDSLYEPLKLDAIEFNAWRAYTRISQPLNWCCVNMTLRGVAVDTAQRSQLHKTYLDRQHDVESKLLNLGLRINVNSNQEVANFLYNELRLKPKSYTPKGAPRVDEDSLLQFKEEVLDERFQLILDARHYTKMISTYILGPHVGPLGRVHPTWRPWGTVSWRLASRDPNLQNLPREDEGVLRSMYVVPPGHIFVHRDFCVGPNTRILKADLTWTSAEDLKVGDELIGFDENLANYSCWKLCMVKAIKVVVQPSYKVTTDLGSVICSGEHRWATNGPVWKYTATQNLKVGDEIPFFAQPWEFEDSFDSGWMSGIFDGEGSLSIDCPLQFGQKPGAVLDRGVRILTERGFNTKISPNGSGVMNVRVQGGVGEYLRGLGIFKPTRLSQNHSKIWFGRRIRTKVNRYAVVQNIEQLGEMEVIGIETTTGTFIAEGLLSHNSQIEYRLQAILSQDPVLIKRFKDFDEGKLHGLSGLDLKRLDPHALNASNMWKVMVDDVTPEQRFRAKIFVYGVMYGGSAESILAHGGRGLSRNTANLENLKDLSTNFFDQFPIWSTWRKVTALKARLERRYDNLITGAPRLWFTRDGSAIERECLDYTGQGHAAAVMNRAHIRIENRLSELNIRPGVILQIHDALIAECPDSKADVVSQIMKDEMERPVKILGAHWTFPTAAKFGRNWMEASRE